MTMKLVRALCMFAALLAGYAQPLTAEILVWNVSLSGVALGQVQYSDAMPQRLETQVDRTPLGVFDGTFEAYSKALSAGVTNFASSSRTTRKGRDISFNIDNGVVGNVMVLPLSEQTRISQPSRVPRDVLDPVRAFGRLARASSCPAPFQLYDGRRVVAISTDSTSQENGGLTCQVTYQIVKGPGHLSPFRFKRFAMELTYGTGAPELRVLEQLILKVGVFTLRLRR